jgi:hypothetical protein
MNDLAALNRAFESTGALPPETWTEWLWRSDPDEPCDPMVLLNRNQLLGLLVCRYRARHHTQRVGGDCGRLSLGDDKTQTWQGLKDTLANIQIEWPEFLARLADNPDSQANLAAVRGLVEECTARFGALLGRGFPAEVLDDVSDTEPAGKHERQLTVGAMRRMVGTLLMLYRHLHLLAVCETLPVGPRDCGLNKHHHEASMDDFFAWHMHFQLPVAAKLNYKHDFPGLYNHVTQVVYFHNSSYERAPRDLARGPIHLLPSLRQVHPEVPVRFEEDHFDPTSSQGWYWLVVAGRVYLVSPEPKVLYSEDATAMLGYYLDHKKTK